METRPKIHIRPDDLDRLRRLVDGTRKTENVLWLEEELERATVVPEDGELRGVVVMGSRVVFRDEQSGQEDRATLVYPSEADPAAGRISVLAPVGSALLGLTVGDAIEWPVPNGKTRKLRIVAVEPPEPGAPGH